MKLHDALIQQAPSLELQRAAQVEIAKLTAQVAQLDSQLMRVHQLSVMKLADCPREFIKHLDQIIEAARHIPRT